MRTIEDILLNSKNIAVVGLSPKPDRPAMHVAEYLQHQGYRILPINPNFAGQEVLGEPIYPNLQAAADALAQEGQVIDVVDCFRKAEDMPEVAREAVAIRAKVLWMQLGIVNQSAADMAASAGLDVVMDRCMKIEHAALGLQP